MLSRHSQHLPRLLTRATNQNERCNMCSRAPAACTRIKLSLSDPIRNSADSDEVCDKCVCECTGLSDASSGVVLMEIQGVNSAAAVERVLQWGYYQQMQTIPNEPLFLQQMIVVAEVLGFRELRALCIDRVMDLGYNQLQK